MRLQSFAFGKKSVWTWNSHFLIKQLWTYMMW